MGIVVIRPFLKEHRPMRGLWKLKMPCNTNWNLSVLCKIIRVILCFVGLLNLFLDSQQLVLTARDMCYNDEVMA